VKYLNETTTVSCYSLYISSDGTLQLSIQGMWTADSSHFISLLTTTLKYVTILSFTERPSGSPLPPSHAFTKTNHSAFRKSLVLFHLDVLLERVFFITIKNLETFVGSKVIAIKMSRIYLFVILGKHGNTLQCEELVVYVYIYIYEYIRTYKHNHHRLIIFCQFQLLYVSTNSHNFLHYTITSTVLQSHS